MKNEIKGVSQWREEGKKYKYWEFFEDQIKEKIYKDLITVAEAGEYEDLRREVERYFNHSEKI